MKKNRCPICHSSVKKNFLRNYDADGNNKMFVYDKCNDCGLVWISSVTDKNELNDYYYDSYYGGRQGLVTKIRGIFKYFVNKSRYHLIRKYKISGIMLDCGCGNGDFIKYLSTYTDFTVYGQDISLSSETEIKKRELDIQYYNTDLLDMEFTDYFDVITLWDVFEHVTNPAEYLKKLYGMLKKNGYLVIQVQNIDSWQASLNLVDWFHFDTPRHVYNYTPYNLSVFLKKNGFSIREIKHFSTEHGIFGWFQTIFNYLGFEFNVFYKFIKHGIINKNPFQLAMNILISPVICVVSIMLHIIESICSKSGIITVVAEKNN